MDKLCFKNFGVGLELQVFEVVLNGFGSVDCILELVQFGVQEFCWMLVVIFRVGGNGLLFY